MAVKPITPGEVVKVKAATLPDEVLTIWNEAIAAAWSGSSAVVKQTEIAGSIASRMDCTRDHVYKEHWLDIEPVFRAAGWKVVYDSPAYCESDPATFTFTKKR